jgi:hypothetical protein
MTSRSSGTTAEERRWLILVSDQGPYLIDIPDVVLVGDGIRRLTSFRVASVSQFAVTVDSMVTPPLQFIADRGLAGAGKAFDQEILPAHCWTVQRCGGHINAVSAPVGQCDDQRDDRHLSRALEGDVMC